MMIVTDTASDIFEDEAALLDVRLVPLDISFGGRHFQRNTPAEFDLFYDLLKERSDFPVTSQPSPELYRALYDEARERDEEVLVIALSGALSGTVESARMAAELSGYSERITIMDSRHAIASQRLLVELAVKLRAEGCTAAEILPQLEDLRDRIRICGVLDSLEYLRRGGRVPKTLAVVGDILSIKPVVCVDDGAVESVAKVRGHHAGNKYLRREYERLPHDDSWQVAFLYSKGLELVDEFAEDFCARFGLAREDTRTIQIGPTIGAHLGPDCVGLMFVSDRPIA